MASSLSLTCPDAPRGPTHHFADPRTQELRGDGDLSAWETQAAL